MKSRAVKIPPRPVRECLREQLDFLIQLWDSGQASDEELERYREVEKILMTSFARR